MKKLRTIVTIVFFLIILLGMTSCEIRRHADNDRNRYQKSENNNRRRGTVLIIKDNNRERRNDDDNHDR
jgi:hypothetical protein